MKERKMIMELLSQLEQKTEQSETQLKKIKDFQLKALIDELKDFEQGKSDLTSLELLKKYQEFKQMFGKSEKLDKQAQCLFEDFISCEDLLGASKFLRCRCGSEFDSKFSEKRKLYMEHISKYPIPQHSDYADCVIGYGEHRTDILRFFELCGKIDYMCAPEEIEGIHYSDATKRFLAMASIGEFGKLYVHAFADALDSFAVCDRDRQLLIACHDKAYTDEQLKETTKGI